MSKKYRLIKKYPGLPSDWSINMEVGVGDYIKEYYKPCSTKYTDFGVKISSVINYPEFWEEIKYPVLKTDDGVDLYKNDYFWHVDPYFRIGKGVLDTAYPEFKPIKGYKHFSTEKAAKDWVEMNKPKYSMKDVLEMRIWNIKDRHTLELNLSELCKIYKIK